MFKISSLAFLKKRFGVKISKYLDQKNIVFLNADSRDDALSELVESLENSGKLKNKKLFFNAILEREKIVSTGIGMGIAIPHAKLNTLNDFFIAIGIQRKRGLDWQSLDQSLVKVIFMIGGPEKKQEEYLQILSRLTFVIRDENIRKKLLQETSTAEIISLFESF